MKSITKRVLTAVVAIPLLIAVIIFLPQAHYLAFCLLCVVVCIIGSYEMRGIVDHENQAHLILPPWVGSLLLIAAYVEKAYYPQFNLTLFALVSLLTIGYALEAFLGYHDNFKNSKQRLEIFTLEVIYPNLLGTFLIGMAFMNDAYIWILTFLLFVFGSDTFAYLFGIWLGKNNRGILKVSPNKSIAGFVFGILLPALIGLVFALVFPFYNLTWYQGFILGFMTSLAGACGDLIESAFKRSASIKDSGKIIPGRGGILDSVDSILIAAPIYILVLFTFSL